MRYRVYVCGPSDCPNDSRFEHDHYFGCVPKDFNQRTGRSKTFAQREVATEDGPRWKWNGGCDASLVGPE